MSTARIIISGGGTAGHLYPALALGQKLMTKLPDVEITYVGSDRKLEKKIMRHHQVDFIPLRIEGIKGRGWKTLRALMLLPWAFWRSYRTLRRLRPSLVVGVGGYSAGPVVLLAAKMKIPTLILEQNRFPGFTNRRLLPFVDKAVAAFESSVPEFQGKGIFLGNPVREEFYHLLPKSRGDRLTLLVFGGSQGSHFLNTRITAALPLLKDQKERLQIFHQTGEKDLNWVQESYAEQGFTDVTVSDFFYDMPDRFQKSDLIISRSGASTIAELIAAKKASILVPFAGATEDHQTQNAKELVNIQAAAMIAEKDFASGTFADQIKEFLKNQEKITHMENNLFGLQTGSAVAENIADLCMDLMAEKLTW